MKYIDILAYQKQSARRNLTIKKGTRSLSNKGLRPFTIRKVISRHAYKLNIPSNYRLHNVIHTSLLKPFKSRPDWQSQNEYGPEFNEEDIEFDVERVIDSRRRRGKVEYRIRWDGYQEQLNEFHLKFPRLMVDPDF